MAAQFRVRGACADGYSHGHGLAGAQTRGQCNVHRPTPNDLFLPARLCLPKAPVSPKQGPKLGIKDLKF